MGSGKELIPSTPVYRLTRPFLRFLHVQAAGGVVLLVATLLALFAANTIWADSFAAIWNTTFELRLGEIGLAYPLWYWINDGLMAIFFFVIGLEIKRELVWGELRDRRNVILPAAAALGGAVVPVGIFLLLQRGTPSASGWAVPMATDIAFVVGCMALLGRRVPAGLKVFVLSLAIIDDILAVIIIAAFFSETIKLAWLAGAGAGFIAIIALNRGGLRRVPVYVGIGALIWLCTLKAGVHPTVAGALLGLLTPANAWLGTDTLRDVAERALSRLRGDTSDHDQGDRREAAITLSLAATESVSPLSRLEHGLHPWVSFLIMPIFALANAGVPVNAAGLGDPAALSVAAGLVVGKPVGIVAACALMVGLGRAQLPEGSSWSSILGAGCLAGIGFTMALFIGSLSLAGEVLTSAKTGILLGSGVSLVLGMTILFLTGRNKARAVPTPDAMETGGVGKA